MDVEQLAEVAGETHIPEIKLAPVPFSQSQIPNVLIWHRTLIAA